MCRRWALPLTLFKQAPGKAFARNINRELMSLQPQKLSVAQSMRLNYNKWKKMNYKYIYLPECGHHIINDHALMQRHILDCKEMLRKKKTELVKFVPNHENK